MGLRGNQQGKHFFLYLLIVKSILTKFQIDSAVAKKEMDGLRATDAEEMAFRKFLCALHGKAYTIISTRELSDITRLAEFYCALPMVSRSLYAALPVSPDFIRELPSNSSEILVLAQKLRHPTLFRDALIHVVSRWKQKDQDSRNMLNNDQKLCKVVDIVYNRLSMQILGALHLIMAASTRNGELRKIFMERFGYLNDSLPPTGSASFYRSLYNRLPALSGCDSTSVAKAALKGILQNELVLGRSNSEAGIGLYSQRFLCASIEDSELPWDLDAEDW
jgi:hypothetical protein